MIIKNGLVFTLKDGGSFEPLTIKTDGDKIVRVIPAGDTRDCAEAALSEKEFIDATDCYVIPGLVDIHFHGAMGADFSDGTAEALETICKYELQNGITDICPATMTISEPEVEQAIASAVTLAKATLLSDIIGIHLEGPFLSPERAGAQNPDFILPPDPLLIEKWQDMSQGLLRLMTIAPEMPLARECIHKFKNEIHFSIGHTTADYDTALAAIQAGADHITHLYNAMPGLNHRSPGVIGAAADSEICMVELICDGIHVAPAVVRSTFKLFGADRVILISDSIRATGMPDGTYSLGGQAVTVWNGKATLKGETIAGSVTNLYTCMVNAVKMGIPLPSAIKAATINPCKSIGADKLLGSVEVGKKAHLLLIDKENLSIKRIIK